MTDKFDLDVGSTMGVSISSKNLVIEGFKINVQIWDMIGDELFRPLLTNYARGAFGGIFMYDITRKETLLNIDTWFSLFQNKLVEWRGQIPILIVGGKSDLTIERKTNLEEASNLSKSYNILDNIECSAKTGENIDKLFMTLIIEIMKRSKFI